VTIQSIYLELLGVAAGEEVAATIGKTVNRISN